MGSRSQSHVERHFFSCITAVLQLVAELARVPALFALLHAVGQPGICIYVHICASFTCGGVRSCPLLQIAVFHAHDVSKLVLQFLFKQLDAMP